MDRQTIITYIRIGYIIYDDFYTKINSSTTRMEMLQHMGAMLLKLLQPKTFTNLINHSIDFIQQWFNTWERLIYSANPANILHYTAFEDFMRVYNALSASKFAFYCKATFASSFVAQFAAYLGDFLFGEQHYQILKYWLSSYSTLPDTIINAARLAENFCSELMPALIYGDPTYLSPYTFTSKLQAITTLTIAVTQNDYAGMNRGIALWRNTQFTYDNQAVMTEALVVLEAMEQSVKLSKVAGVAATQRTLTDIILAKSLIRSKEGSGTHRLQPFCVALFGPAGSGKTELVPLITSATVSALGLSTTVDEAGVHPPDYVTYDWVSAFQSNISNQTEVILFDDLGILTSQSDQARATMAAFMQITGNASVAIPRAEIENKSGQYYNNKLCIVTGNTEYMHLPEVVTNREAIERRLYLYVCVKRNGTEQTYQVRRYDEQQYVELNLRELLVRINAEAQNFVNGRNGHKNAMRNQSILCRACMLPSAACTCAPLIACPYGNRPRNIQLVVLITLLQFVCNYFMQLWLDNFFIGFTLYFFLDGYVNGDFSVWSLVGWMLDTYFTGGILLHIVMNVVMLCPDILLNYVASIGIPILEAYLAPMLARLTTDLPPRFIDGTVDVIKVKITDCRQRILTVIWDNWLFKLFGILSGSAIVLYVMTLLHELALTYTMIGDKPSDQVIADTELINQDNTKGVVYSPPVGGMANTYAAYSHTVALPTHTGNYPKSLTDVHEAQVFIGEEYKTKVTVYPRPDGLYTVKHVVFAGKIGDVLTFRFLINKGAHVVHYKIEDQDIDPNHDILFIPCILRVSSVNIIGLYKPSNDDLFLCRNIVVKFEGLIKATSGTKDISRPFCGYKLSMQSQGGWSGSPVYLISQSGKKVCAVVGLLSSKTPQGFAVFTPFPLINRYTLDFNPTPLPPISMENKTHKKSILNHLPSITNIGSYMGSIMFIPSDTSTQLRKSAYFDAVMSRLPTISDLVVPHLNPRVVSGAYINPYLAAARQLQDCKIWEDENCLYDASHVVLRKLLEFPMVEYKPLTIHQTIMGTGMTQPLNRKTSQGFGRCGVKEALICGSFDNAYFSESFTKELMEAINDLDKGITPLNIAVASVKDEIVTKAKDDTGLHRIFYAGNVMYLVLCRMYLSPLMEHFMRYRHMLFGQVGMNAIGLEFDSRLRKMALDINVDIQEKCWLDTDFSKYDKKLQIISYGVYVLQEFIARIHFQDGVIKKRIHVVLNGLSNYYMVLNGDIFHMTTKMPSGVFGTAWLNCICEAIIEVTQYHYVRTTFLNEARTPFWLKRSEDAQPFFSNVSLINYGDDNLKCLSNEARKYYTHNSIISFGDWFGMPITPARKQDTTIELKYITDVTFLKRTPTLYSGVYVGRLAIESIGKMLAFTDSNVEDWADVIKRVACMELSYHDLNTFSNWDFVTVNEDKDELMKQALNSNFIQSMDEVTEEVDCQYTMELREETIQLVNRYLPTHFSTNFDHCVEIYNHSFSMFLTYFQLWNSRLVSWRYQWDQWFPEAGYYTDRVQTWQVLLSLLMFLVHPILGIFRNPILCIQEFHLFYFLYRSWLFRHIFMYAEYYAYRYVKYIVLFWFIVCVPLLNAGVLVFIMTLNQMLINTFGWSVVLWCTPIIEELLLYYIPETMVLSIMFHCYDNPRLILLFGLNLLHLPFKVHVALHVIYNLQIIDYRWWYVFSFVKAVYNITTCCHTFLAVRHRSIPAHVTFSVFIDHLRERQRNEIVPLVVQNRVADTSVGEPGATIVYDDFPLPLPESSEDLTTPIMAQTLDNQTLQDLFVDGQLVYTSELIDTILDEVPIATRVDQW